MLYSIFHADISLCVDSKVTIASVRIVDKRQITEWKGPRKRPLRITSCCSFCETTRNYCCWSMLSPSLIFAALRRLLISASKAIWALFWVILNHGLLLLFRHAAGFHLIQRYQHHIALHIAAHAVDRFTLLRQRQGKCQLAQRIRPVRESVCGAPKLRPADFIASSPLPSFSAASSLSASSFACCSALLCNDIANLCLHFGQRLHRLGFVFANAQNKSAIAVNGNDIGVAARRAVLTHQTAVENSVSDRFKVQLLRQVIAAKPAGFYDLHPGDLRCARQRFIIVAGRIAHLLLQRVVSIQRFSCFTFAAMSLRTSASGFTCAGWTSSRRATEANRGFDHARQLAFLSARHLSTQAR